MSPIERNVPNRSIAGATSPSPEFPQGSDSDLLEGISAISRRGFLKSMAAALAASQLAACSKRSEKIVPYVHMPERLIPGRPEFYATTLTRQGIGKGVLVESHMGRPTRIEGNPKHPESLGAVDSITQAEILTLYDPDRSQTVTQKGSARASGDAQKALNAFLDNLSEGEGAFIVTEDSTSPSYLKFIDDLRRKHRKLGIVFYSAVGREQMYAATEKVFGRQCAPVYNFHQARVILSVGGDFLSELPGSLRYARDFIATRSGASPSRLFCIEPTLSLTGSRADRRFPAGPLLIEGFLGELKQALLPGKEEVQVTLPPDLMDAVQEVATALKEVADRSLVVPGEYLHPTAQALCHQINHALGNIGTTVEYIGPIEGNGTHSIRDFLSALREKQVQRLLIMDVNIAYTLANESDLRTLIESVPTKIHAGLFYDETAQLCDWHIPLAHELESWGDARSFDGSVSFQQPLINPLFGGWSRAEIVSFLEGSRLDGYTILSAYWRGLRGDGDFETWFQHGLQDGVVSGDPGGAKISVRPAAPIALDPSTQVEGLTIVFRPDPALFDGRYANNGWLEELPRPFTKLTWDNALLLSPDTASAAGVETGNVVRLRSTGREIEIPVVILRGLPAGVGTLFLGYGRTRAGRVGDHVGTSVESLRSVDTPWILKGVKLSPLKGASRRLAITHGHQSMEGRDLARTALFSEALNASHDLPNPATARPSLELFKEPLEGFYQWGMSINLNSCIGCNACVTACQSENNIPFVGRKEVLREREMHWIRIDTYFEGSGDNPQILFQPVPCMHCEQAPCELVCPVGATVHSGEGLNEMVYNRCVGTRYCSNNCPYKVRRFNFFHYTDTITPLLKMLQNPDVTVRSRGVMEKCTYCVQRIEEARIRAEKENRTIKDGEIKTACQQACPTQAIVFGDIRDPDSVVSKAKKNPQSYSLLSELNTRPRTTYLPRLKHSEET